MVGYMPIDHAEIAGLQVAVAPVRGGDQAPLALIGKDLDIT
jgi:hypothetical protein